MLESNMASPKEGSTGEYVSVSQAKTLDQAERIRDILEDHDIPAIVDDDDHSGEMPDDIYSDLGEHLSISVLVPEEYLEEASEIIADDEDSQDFIADDDFTDDDDSDQEFDFADNIDDGDDSYHLDIDETEELL